ncbi:aldehyde dehydrogenase family protein [Bacillus sp. Marseille-P3661]|uniref:aldehyde dehydrogenase family protein n=1 Tax=Bacillus sp. Marseille-P3661 TaxID=1936234 RepID=UPI0015E16895|nr:aldehyde dehydrogenase family protein [Bacillus sp. Marseille-P3661]
MVGKKQMLINGKWVEGKAHYQLYSPYSNEKIAEVPLADEQEVTTAIEAAEQAKKVMAKMPAHQRAEILERVSRIFQERFDECAMAIVKENAKPIQAARTEIARTIETYKFAAEEAKRIHGETIPLDASKSGEGRFAYTRREPLGVIAAITPFNFPFNLVAHKLGPAFAAGNTVVLKPATKTPLSALLTAEIFEQAGLPAGALNVVTGKGSVIGDLLVKDYRVKMVTFTGSVDVGLGIKAKSGLKKTTLELGSNSVIVHDTDNLDTVVERCLQGAFAFSGQVCISVQRIFVKRDLYESFLQKLVSKAKTLVLGDPVLEETAVSALIDESEAIRVEEWCKEAVVGGAKIECGGKRYGALMEPTILTGADSSLSIACKEAFGPIVVVNPYDTWDEAIEKVNDTTYGLQAGVYTLNTKLAFDAVERIEVGGVIINDIPTFRVDHMPYGGIKESGMGREGIKYSVEEMTELKFVSFKLS